MSIINEETSHDELPATISVLEKEKGELVGRWRIIEFQFDEFEMLTPTELCDLGKWLVKEGERIKREYKPNGAKV